MLLNLLISNKHLSGLINWIYNDSQKDANTKITLSFIDQNVTFGDSNRRCLTRKVIKLT